MATSPEPGDLAVQAVFAPDDIGLSIVYTDRLQFFEFLNGRFG